jgi:hypothetical protein
LHSRVKVYTNFGSGKPEGKGKALKIILKWLTNEMGICELDLRGECLVMVVVKVGILSEDRAFSE